MAIDIFNNFNLNASKPIEKRFEFTKVTDAIASGYEYPDGAIHYFTADSTNYPKGLYKYESGAWTLIKQGEDLPEDMARIDVYDYNFSITALGVGTPYADAENDNKTYNELVTNGVIPSEFRCLPKAKAKNTDNSQMFLLDELFYIMNIGGSIAVSNQKITLTYSNKTYILCDYTGVGNYHFITRSLATWAESEKPNWASVVITIAQAGESLNISIREGTITSGYILTFKGTLTTVIGASGEYAIPGLETKTAYTNIIESATGTKCNDVDIPSVNYLREYVAEHGGGGSGTTNYNELTNKPLVNESNGDVSASGDLILNKGGDDEVTVASKLAELEQQSSEFVKKIKMGGTTYEPTDGLVTLPSGGGSGSTTLYPSRGQQEDGAPTNKLLDDELEKITNGKYAILSNISAGSEIFNSSQIAGGSEVRFVGSAVSSPSGIDIYINNTRWTRIDLRPNCDITITLPNDYTNVLVRPDAHGISTLTIYSSSVFSLNAINIRLTNVQNVVEGDIVETIGSNIDSEHLYITSSNLLKVSHSSYSISKPIKINAGDRIITTETLSFVTSVSYITECDADGVPLNMIYGGKSETKALDIQIDRVMYVLLCHTNGNILKFNIVRASISKRVDVLSSALSTLDARYGTDGLEVISNNPLEKLIRHTGYAGIIHQWGIIGDSLSSGEMQCFDDSSTSTTDFKFIDMYQWSWGQRFAKINGVDCYNYSNGGQSSRGWIKGSGAVHDEYYIGGIGGGSWSKAKTEPKQGYIIALAVNDLSQIEKGNYVLGSVSAIQTYDGTDSDIDDTSTNPQSYARFYAGIIQRIKSISPYAKIFCVTPLQDKYAQISQIIRDIVSLYDDVYLIDLATYCQISWTNEYNMNGHGSSIGYEYTAYEISTYIDWIIRKNPNDFKGTALIGTDYREKYS